MTHDPIYDEFVADINARVKSAVVTAYEYNDSDVCLHGWAEQWARQSGDEIERYPVVLNERGDAEAVGWDTSARVWGFHRQTGQVALDESDTLGGGFVRAEVPMVFVFSMPRAGELHPTQVGAWIATLVNASGAHYDVQVRQIQSNPFEVMEAELPGRQQTREVASDRYLISIEYRAYFYTSFCGAPC